MSVSQWHVFRSIDCSTYIVQMMHEKRMERRRQRRKAAEHLQQDQEAELMTMSPAASATDHHEPVDGVVVKQQGVDAPVDHVRQRRPRRRRKQSAVDGENSEKYENCWQVTRSESEHLAGAVNNTDSMPSRSEPSALNQDAPSLTPHPAVYTGISTPFASRDLTVQPAFVHQLTCDGDLIDVDTRPYCPPHQSNV